MRPLIITADDFGQSLEINEAVERACRDGVLRAASLMVAAPAAADAIRRARRLPALRVGLHLVLVCGEPMLPAGEIPHLVDGAGRFPDNLVAAAVRWSCSAATRRELSREINAQFDAFDATGLTMDHVNVHNHMQLHPGVLGEVIRTLQARARCAVRVPREPWSLADGWRGILANRLLAPWVATVRRRLADAGLVTNDWLLGMMHSGALDEARWLDLLARLPAGVVEIHCHPAVRRTEALARLMPGYDNEGEFAALTSPRVAAALAAQRLVPCAFGDLDAFPPAALHIPSCPVRGHNASP